MKKWHLLYLIILIIIAKIIKTEFKTIDSSFYIGKFLDAGNDSDNILEKYLSVKYKLWKKGILGKGIKIGIIDSGIKSNICNSTKIYNFSDEQEEDLNGHGTYLASVICHCKLGISPDSEIYSYKIFNKSRKTRNEFLIKALERASRDKLDILNFSFGSIKFDDELISQKLQHLVKEGVILVTSAGNDGPSLGTINFPGTLPYVITVGASNKKVFSILNSSSRGPAIFAKNFLLNKPNTWAPGESIPGLDLNGNLIFKEGSSVSSALVTGFISLLLSNYYDQRNFFNIATIMILIKESNLNLPELTKDELNGGIFNLDAIIKLANFYLNNKNLMKPQILNNIVDLTLRSYSNFSISVDYKPFQAQPVYSTISPIFFSLIFVNPISRELQKVNLNHKKNSKLETIDDCILIKILNKNLNFFYFKGHVGVIQLSLSILEEMKCQLLKENVDYQISFIDDENYLYQFKLRFDIEPTPSRFSRILISRYHNLFYPFDGNIPKDNLYDDWYNYDWTYESINTNYFSLFLTLKKSNFYIEEAHENLDCFDLSNYSILIFIDVESHLTSSEIHRLRIEYENYHLSLLFITDWFHPLLNKEFYLEYNKNETLGKTMDLESPIKTFNLFLKFYGIKLDEDSISKILYYDDHIIKIKSGSSISEFPNNSYLFGGNLNSDYKKEIQKKAVLGFTNQLKNMPNSGRIGVFTDTYCMDDYQLRQDKENCIWLIDSLIKFLIHGDYISNKLKLKDKKLLDQDYSNRIVSNDEMSDHLLAKNYKKSEKCSYRNYSQVIFEKSIEPLFQLEKSKETTFIIPNYMNEPPLIVQSDNENKLISIIEDFIYVLAPILTIVILLLFLIYCRNNRIRRLRMTINISQYSANKIQNNSSELNDSSSLIINNFV